LRLSGQSIDLLAPREGADVIQSILDSIRAGEHVEEFETVPRRKDGTLLDVSITLTAIMSRSMNSPGEYPRRNARRQGPGEYGCRHVEDDLGVRMRECRRTFEKSIGPRHRSKYSARRPKALLKMVGR
jgi:hypothetical protein